MDVKQRHSRRRKKTEFLRFSSTNHCSPELIVEVAIPALHSKPEFRKLFRTFFICLLSVYRKTDNLN